MAAKANDKRAPIVSRFDFDAAGFDHPLQEPTYGGAKARLESKRVTEFGGRPRLVELFENI